MPGGLRRICFFLGWLFCFLGRLFAEDG